MSIKLQLDGFDELLKKIEKAGGSIDAAAETCLKKSANIMEAELKTQMSKADVDAALINRMPAPTIEKDGNRMTARVGYKKGAYNPNNISDGYKVVFLNYGTPKRKKHGKIKARGFIAKAKKKAKPQIKRQQETTLDEILRGLR